MREATPPLRIGIVGGTFDPVHTGHCILARMAQSWCTLDRILFIPAFVQPHKTGQHCAPVHHRLAMLTLATAGEPTWHICTLEIDRTGLSYTIDTLRSLHRMYPDSELFFIIGADNLIEIPTWHDYPAILDLVTLCVGGRPGFGEAIPPQLSGARIVSVPSTQSGCSSRDIRARIEAGQPFEPLVPTAVADYIEQHALYRNA